MTLHSPTHSQGDVSDISSGDGNIVPTGTSNATESNLSSFPKGNPELTISHEIVSEKAIGQKETKTLMGRQMKERRALTSGWWWWELGAALLSLVCMSLIIVVLSIMDGQPLSRWGLAISPNAVVAVLTTVAKSALLLLVAECVSQLKWLHFNSPRRLSDLQAFDDASRGPWGSFVFVWYTKGTAIVATICCFVILVSLGFEPTAQQVLDFPTRTVVGRNETGTLGIASQFNFDGSSGLNLSSPGGINPGIKAPSLSLQLAIFTGLTGDVPNVQNNCTTSECHFNDVTSIGICGTCEDNTASLERNCTYQNGTTPSTNPLYNTGSWLCDFKSKNGNLGPVTASMTFYEGLFPSNETVMSVTAGLGGNWDFYQDERISFTVIKRTNGFGNLNLNDNSDNLVQSNRCSWHWCERAYANFSIINGDFRSSAITEEPLISVRPIIEYTGGSYELTPKSTRARNYTVDIVSDASIFSHLVALLNKDLNSGSPYGRSEEQPDPVLHLLYQQDVANVTNNIALALSNKLRESGTNPNATLLQGTAMRQETFIHVRWVWLILPMGLTILGAILLIISIVMSERRQEPLLKSSLLAVLFHGAEGFSQEEMKPPTFENPNTLSDIAKTMKVELRWNDNGVLKFEKLD